MQAPTPQSGAYADTGVAVGNISGDVHISAYCGTDSSSGDFGVLMGLEEAYDSDGPVYTNRYSLSVAGTRGFGTSVDYWYNSNPDLYVSSGDYNTSFGRDSGAIRCLMRQFLALKSGDVLTIRNWESNNGAVQTSENPGGSFPGQNSLLIAFMLSPLCIQP
jgi:hypothetical protein